MASMFNYQNKYVDFSHLFHDNFFTLYAFLWTRFQFGMIYTKNNNNIITINN